MTILIIDNYDSFTWNVVQYLWELGAEVEVHRNDAITISEIETKAPAGICISPGPCSPAEAGISMAVIEHFAGQVPIFGICLGHQVLTHAIGAQTYKLKFGHRGGNQPVKNVETGKVSITSQNHGFACDKDKLEEMGAIVTEYNLNDQTVSGMRLKDLPVFSVQYHPEASPGPNDANHLFNTFHQLVTEHKKTDT